MTISTAKTTPRNPLEKAYLRATTDYEKYKKFKLPKAPTVNRLTHGHSPQKIERLMNDLLEILDKTTSAMGQFLLSAAEFNRVAHTEFDSLTENDKKRVRPYLKKMYLSYKEFETLNVRFREVYFYDKDLIALRDLLVGKLPKRHTARIVRSSGGVFEQRLFKVHEEIGDLIKNHLVFLVIYVFREFMKGNAFKAKAENTTDLPSPEAELNFLAQNSTIFTKHRGKWIALVEKQIVASSADLAKVSELAAKAGHKNPLVMFIPLEATEWSGSPHDILN